MGASGSLVPLFSQIQTNSTNKVHTHKQGPVSKNLSDINYFQNVQISNTSFQGTDRDIAYIEISTSICSITAALLTAILIDCTKLF